MISSTTTVAKVFFISSLETLGLFPHLFMNVFLNRRLKVMLTNMNLKYQSYLSLMILVLTTGLEVELVNAPVLKIVAEGQDTHFFDQMQFSCPVKVQDGGKGPRVPVKEELVVLQVVVVAQLHQHLVCVAVFSDATQSSVG